MAKASFNEPNPVPNIAGWRDVPSLSHIERKNLASVLEDDDKNSIQIYLRLRPNPMNESTEENFKIIDSKTVEVKPPADSTAAKSNRSGHSDETQYIFSQVFEPHTSQKILFNSCVLNSVHNFINTKSCLLFSYGTTNAGKTYTIHGSKREPGIIPRVLSILFKSIKSKQCSEEDGVKFRPEYGNSVKELNSEEIKEQCLIKERILNYPTDASGVDLFHSAVTHQTYSSLDPNISAAPSEFSQMEEFMDDEVISVENEGNVIYSVWVSFLEVYNEYVYDLLVPPTSDKRKPLKIAQDHGRNYFVKGLKHVHVTTGIEAYKVLLVGKNNLQVASTNLNRSSSRSHCVFSIKLIKRENVENPNVATLSSFSICDLAGAERLEKTGNTGNRMKETQNINTSLHVLVRCFKTILENQSRPSKPEIVPYRDSKLTQLFHRQLSGKFAEDVIMIVNVNPSPKLYEETAFVLKASAIAKQIVKRPIQRPNMNKRKSMFSFLVYENKNRETIPWESIEENPSKGFTVDLEQLYQEFELEKQKIRDECEEVRMKSVMILENEIQDMISEHKEQLSETQDLYMRERIRRENLYRECIADLKAQIVALTSGQANSQLSSTDEQSNSLPSSGYGSLTAGLENAETLEQNLQEANKEILELKSELTKLKLQNRELLDKIENLEKESGKVVSLEKDLRLSQQKAEKLKKLLDEARVDMLEIDAEKSQLTENYNDAQSKITDLSEEIEELKKDIACKTETIEALETDIEKNNQLIENLTSEIDARDVTIESLRNDVDELQKKNEHIVVHQDRLLNTVENQRDRFKEKNTQFEKKITEFEQKITELTEANEVKTAENQKIIEDYEKRLKDLQESLENQGVKAKPKRIAKKNFVQLFDCENKEQEPPITIAPKTEPKRRIRTRNQIRGMDKSPNKRRSKSADTTARIPLKVQYPNNVSANRTPSPGSLFSESEKRLTKSCRKMLWNSRDFADDGSEPIDFNPIVLASPKSELKNVKRRLRNNK